MTNVYNGKISVSLMDLSVPSGNLSVQSRCRGCVLSTNLMVGFVKIRLVLQIFFISFTGIFLNKTHLVGIFWFGMSTLL